MSNNSQQFEFDSLGSSLETAVQAVLAETSPDDAVQRVIKHAQRLGNSSPSLPQVAVLELRRWKSPRKIVGGLAAAAMVAVSVVGTVLVVSPPGNFAFAQMVEKVCAARTVKFNIHSLMGPNSSSGVAYIVGNMSRVEQENGNRVSITDIDQGKILILDNIQNRYNLIPLDKQIAQESANAIERLRHVNSRDAEFVSEEEFQGRPAVIYRIDNSVILGAGAPPSYETLVWIDIKSNLPVRIVAKDLTPNSLTEIRYTGFLWDDPVDPKFFSFEIPAGYQEVP